MQKMVEPLLHILVRAAKVTQECIQLVLTLIVLLSSVFLPNVFGVDMAW